MDTDQHWPQVKIDDAGLLKELGEILAARVVGSPYSIDGVFAASIAGLPPGLRAMAATHCLDVSLTLDSMTSHFGNFGEIGLVSETEAGLRELGLRELADCFAEAKDLMMPLIAQRTESEDSDEIIDRLGLSERADEINERALALDNLGPGESVIFNAWIRYTRSNPDSIFGHPNAAAEQPQ